MKKLFSCDGVAAIEAALVLPILFALTFGLIEFGLAIYNKQVITNAAREGARRGIVQEVPRVTKAVIEDVVHQYADAHLITFDSAKPPPQVDVPAVCTGFGADLSVAVTYPYTFLVVKNFVPGLGPLLTLKTVSVMKCE